MERHRALSSGSRSSRESSLRRANAPISTEIGNSFEPCAATATVFLYAEGSTIFCLHHDTLALDKKFQRHTEDVLLIAVDNVSESPGRLVVSYDAGMTAIVWDTFSGEEVSRFASYEPIRVAAWLRNGNITFGNTQGEIILFEPSTSEHISARTIYDPITSIAPNADCRTYAVGYMNGSILIASLQPNFTIRHTLTTSRSPSTVVSLAWHGSSRGQRSDMLACQNRDGDLRVWSVSKEATGDIPKIVRILHRSGDYIPGPNWLSWSKNGKIIQHSEGETCIWDVKTKNVTFDKIPTPRDLTGIAAHGPTGALFTVSRNKAIQQFDLDPPALVASYSPHPLLPPPSPPVSNEGHSMSRNSSGRKSSSSRLGLPKSGQIQSKGGNEDLTPIQRIDHEMSLLEKRRFERSGPLSSASSTAPSIASASSRSSYGPRYHGKASTVSRATTKEGTLMSYGSSIHTGDGGGGGSGGGKVIRSSQSVSSVASSQRSGRSLRGSRLRNEVIPSPDTPKAPTDLFAYASARLSDVPYRNPSLSQTTLTAADLRLQMLSVVFGWKGDIEELIRDEKSRHLKGSSNAVILSKWLNEDDNEIMASMVGADDMSSSNWMLLALSQIGSQNSMKKVGQSFVQKLLEKRDINSAATILLMLGEHDDAVEIYVSHKMYMEAVLLTSLVFSDHWQRISELLKKWGEHAVTHGQQQLAIRCFVCTGQEPTEEWTSPRAQKATFANEMQSLIASVASPTDSHGGYNSSRLTQKNASLRLITSFENRALGPPGGSKLQNPDKDDTPVNAIGVTPIDTAVTPGGFLRTPRTVEIGNRTATPGGYSRIRLPSIGETPTDVTPMTALKAEGGRGPAAFRNKISRSQTASPMVLTASTYASSREDARSPMSEVSKTRLPSPAAGAFTTLREKSRTRNGSQDRKPDGLQINWPPMESIITGDYMSPGSDQGSSRSLRHRSNTDSSLHSPAVTARSLASVSTAQSPMKTGRSIDLYISSLEDANFNPQSGHRYENNMDQASLTTDGGRDRGTRARSSSRKARPRELSEDRGRNGRHYVRPAKKSPASPIPMSPDDLLNPRHNHEDERFYAGTSPVSERHKTATASSRAASRTRTVDPRSSSRHASRRPSPEGRAQSRASSRTRARAQSTRRTSPDSTDTRRARGRSNQRIEAPQRSPASPLSMSPQVVHEGSGEAEGAGTPESQYFEENRQRHRSRQRSTSRKPREAGTSMVRDRSPDPDRVRARSTSRRPRERAPSNTRREVRATSTERRPQHERTSSFASARSGSAVSALLSPMQQVESAAKRSQAARDLEERRQSLARRPSAPPIPHPEELLSRQASAAGRYVDYEDDASHSGSTYRDLAALRSRTVSPLSVSGLSTSGFSTSGVSTNPSSISVGLPATPRAMRHPKDIVIDPRELDDIPDVPQLPESRVVDRQVHDETPDTLAPLPSTRYVPQRQALPRSASAPIPEALSSPPPLPSNLPTHPAFQHMLPPSTRRQASESKAGSSRKISSNHEDAQPGTLGYHGGHAYDRSEAMPLSIDQTISQDIQMDHHATSETEILPELQHLAQNRHHASPPPPPPPPPPPSQSLVPPPPPLHHVMDTASTTVVGGSLGTIDIAMDDLHQNGPSGSDLSSSSGARGRNGQESFGSKIRERMRSASRSRKAPASNTEIRRIASPPYESIPPAGSSPYESIQHFGSDISLRSKSSSSQVTERHPREVRAGMTPEMTRLGFTEGGMI